MSCRSSILMFISIFWALHIHSFSRDTTLHGYFSRPSLHLLTCHTSRTNQYIVRDVDRIIATDRTNVVESFEHLGDSI
ncbi:hypothetical protein DENSPDRAFT_281109 [Dentipellis sp. KUC8613]|nr:hypothetical protein DENSPDRAFT_281109 [Dentipellis sp. KUC8613]